METYFINSTFCAVVNLITVHTYINLSISQQYRNTVYKGLVNSGYRILCGAFMYQLSWKCIYILQETFIAQSVDTYRVRAIHTAGVI